MQTFGNTQNLFAYFASNYGTDYAAITDLLVKSLPMDLARYYVKNPTTDFDALDWLHIRQNLLIEFALAQYPTLSNPHNPNARLVILTRDESHFLGLSKQSYLIDLDTGKWF